MTKHGLAGVTLGGALFAIACNRPLPHAQLTPPSAIDLPAPSSTASSSPVASASAASPPSDDGAAPTWDWQGPNVQEFVGYKRPVELATKAGPCRFTYRDDARSTSIECFGKDAVARVWGYDEGGGFVEDAALAADDATLYVVRYCDISSGAVVTAYDLDGGTQRWRTALLALGPIAHSEYSNHVQASVAPGRVRVLGAEAAGRYIEDLDLRTGATIASWKVDEHDHTSPGQPLPARVVQPVAHPGGADGVAFQFPGTSKLPARDRSIRAGAVSCSYAFERPSDRVHFACTDSHSKRLWGFDLAKQFVASAALAADASRVYVAQYCGISTGASVTAYDATTGRQDWRDALFGDGPVSHSKYSNEVSMRVDRGHLVVSGWESAGKYVEVIETGSGVDLGNRAEP